MLRFGQLMGVSVVPGATLEADRLDGLLIGQRRRP